MNVKKFSDKQIIDSSFSCDTKKEWMSSNFYKVASNRDLLPLIFIIRGWVKHGPIPKNTSSPVKKCNKCNRKKKKSLFYKNNKIKDGLYGHCKKCHNSHVMNLRNVPETKKRYSDHEKSKRKKNRGNEAIVGNRVCRKCGKDKNIVEFVIDPCSKDGRRNNCITCRNKYNLKRYYKILGMKLSKYLTAGDFVMKQAKLAKAIKLENGENVRKEIK